MRILALDVWLPDPRVTYANFSSTQSVFEYDLVIWDPQNTYSHYAHLAESYQGLPSIGEYDSTSFAGDVRRRNAEFHRFLEMGRTLAVIACANLPLYSDTGKREYSGTGKNRVTQQVVRKVDLLSALPYKYNASAGAGSRIQTDDPGFSDLLRTNGKWWSYRAILEEYPGRPLCTVSGSDITIGSIAALESGGTIVQLPDWYYNEVEDDESDDSASAEDEATIPKDLTPEAQDHLGSLLDWLGALNRSTPDELPDWAKRLSFTEDSQRQHDLAAIAAAKAEIQERESSLLAIQAEEDQWKQLVAGTGDALELQVRKAFELLGFETLETPGNRRDLRLVRGDNYAVVEVKGVKKSAAESYGAQLEKWAAEALTEFEIHHKAILVVNGWREASVDARTNPVFPPQMLPYCTSRGHCLVTGLQLLLMVRAVKAGRIDADAAANGLLNTSGLLVGWSELNDAFDTQSRTE